MVTITLKHLCREFDVDPAKLRRVLRASDMVPTGGRWRWDDAKDVRALLTRLKKSGKI